MDVGVREVREDSIKQQLIHSIDDDFVGVFDGFFGDELIDHYIEYFDDCDKSGLTHSRVRTGHKKHKKDDQAISSMVGPLGEDGRPKRFQINLVATKFLDIFWERCYPLYAEKYSILDEMSTHSVLDVIIQKTSPGQGYHIWHSEVDSMMFRNRVLVFNFYLNDVEEGGETDFFYINDKIKPEKGKLAFFPPNWPYVHKGNIPLSGNKYIITGWLVWNHKQPNKT